MALALVSSRALTAVTAPEITVEVHLANGLPAFSIVGLADTEVRESRERVRAALQNCAFDFPAQRITVNLAPADLPKDSGRFDLPIALGILIASGQLDGAATTGASFAGELSLTGRLRPIRGAFAMACGLAGQQQRAVVSGQQPLAPRLYLPQENALEAAHVPGLDVYGVSDLPALYQHLQLRACPKPRSGKPPENNADTGVCHIASRANNPEMALPHAGDVVPHALPDLADVIGQPLARRALEVAAAGAHHLLMIGPPGAGKSMLAARLPGILPPLSDAEALVCAAQRSRSATGFSPAEWRQRPFRTPHHSSSPAALVGGGNPPRPGEMTLAHLGVLFLDELAEFERRSLEMMREPLETGVITVSRAGCQTAFPAACQLIAAMNPCPCGWAGDPSGRCRCTRDQTERYQRKLSGPLLDRIDIQITLSALTPQELSAALDSDAQGIQACAHGAGKPDGHATARHRTSSATVRARVTRARTLQQQRQGCSNAALSSKALNEICPFDAEMRALLEKAMTRFGWTARTHDRIRKITRTIADLAEAEQPTRDHLAEAIQYRRGL